MNENFDREMVKMHTAFCEAQVDRVAHSNIVFLATTNIEERFFGDSWQLCLSMATCRDSLERELKDWKETVYRLVKEYFKGNAPEWAIMECDLSCERMDVRATRGMADVLQEAVKRFDLEIFKGTEPRGKI